MTMEPGVVAQFVGYRTVGSRGVMALVLEVDEEEASQAGRLLGTPVPGRELHVGLVRISDDPDARQEVTTGTYCGLRLVGGRGVLLLTVEVPAELSFRALEALGWPTRQAPIAVAVAPLTGRPERVAPTKDASARAIQQAALLPKRATFQRWILGPRFDTEDASGNELDAIAEVRLQLGITSRRELRDAEKLAEWHAMLNRYEEALQNGTIWGGSSEPVLEAAGEGVHA